MLPVINLRLADYCRVAFNYCLGVSLPIGHSLWFDGDEVQQAGRELESQPRRVRDGAAGLLLPPGNAKPRY